MPERRPGGSAAAALARGAALLALTGCLAACGYLLPRAETAAPSELPEGAYRLDPEHAALLFKIDHLGLSQLVGRFNRFEATLSFDPDNPAASRLSARIDPASIDLDLPAFEQELRGPDWLDVARFPEARFESRAIEVTGGNTGRITGDLTLHGVTQPVTLEVVFNGGGDSVLTGRYTLGFAAAGTISRSAFGLGAYAPAVGDQVVLEIHAEFQRIEGSGS
jgi:polyisoprenoid-binding protein YceI